MDELVVDLFAGGGGASSGIAAALGRDPDIAVNHDPVAVSVHTANHPSAQHFCQSIWQVKPEEACQGRPVGLLWASPDCRHFSRAAGGRPRWKPVRSLPGVVLTWATRVRPRVIVVENVREFLGWGPLLDDGTPCPARIGRSFRSWVGRLRGLGYQVQWRELCAADFGVPTTRTRLFIIARCDGAPIVWPQPTHGRAPGLIERPWVPAASVIDWSLPVRSIFDRPKPLAPATLRRIAAGVARFVLGAAEPFVVTIDHQSNRNGVAPSSAPVSAITGKARHAVVVPTLIQTGWGERDGQAPRVPGLDKPLGTVMAGGAKHALVAAFMAQHNGGVVGHPLLKPVSTLTAQATQQQLVAAQLGEADLRGARRVAAFLVEYYGTGGAESLLRPLPTATTADRFALVTVDGVAQPIADIGMRMLHWRELAAAQGFHPRYVLDRGGDGAAITKTQIVRLIGNSVCPALAEAIVRANVASRTHRQAA